MALKICVSQTALWATRCSSRSTRVVNEIIHGCISVAAETWVQVLILA